MKYQNFNPKKNRTRFWLVRINILYTYIQHRVRALMVLSEQMPFSVFVFFHSPLVSVYAPFFRQFFHITAVLLLPQNYVITRHINRDRNIKHPADVDGFNNEPWKIKYNQFPVVTRITTTITESFATMQNENLPKKWPFKPVDIYSSFE